MIIKNYDMFILKLDKSFALDINSITKPMDNIYCITMFLIYSLRDTIQFIQDINNYPQDRFLFELVEISIDEKNEFGNTALMEACITNNYFIIIKLIGSGAIVNLTNMTVWT